MLIADSQEECISKFKAWKTGLESKKARAQWKHQDQVPRLWCWSWCPQEIGKYPCAVCSCGVGSNSIECSQCKVRVHKTCSGITKRPVADQSYACIRCNGMAWPIDGRTVTEVDIGGTMLDEEATFCYLCGIICSNRGCDSTVAARCCVAWGKFRKLLPVLTTRYLSSIRYAAMCSSEACVLHGSQTWEPNTADSAVALLYWPCHDPLDLWNQRPRRITLSFTTTETWRWWYYGSPSPSGTQMVWTLLPTPDTGGRWRPEQMWSEFVKIDVSNIIWWLYKSTLVE